MVALYEKLRPKTFDDFVGFSEQIQRLESLREACGFGGQVFWISGYSGTGKTTLARIIAADVADPIETEEMDAQDLSVDRIRQIEKMAHYHPYREAQAYIINEAHTLNTKSVSRLQTALEEPQVQKNVTMIFTTTNKGQQHLFDTKLDAFPFLSRAIEINLEVTDQTCHQIVSYLSRIAGQFSLQCGDLTDFYIERCKGNIRMALQKIASGNLT